MTSITCWPGAVHADFTRSRTHLASAATTIVLTPGTLVGAHQVLPDLAQCGEVVHVVAQLRHMRDRGVADPVLETGELVRLAHRDLFEVGEVRVVRGQALGGFAAAGTELAGAGPPRPRDGLRGGGGGAGSGGRLAPQSPGRGAGPGG